MSLCATTSAAWPITPRSEPNRSCQLPVVSVSGQFSGVSDQLSVLVPISSVRSPRLQNFNHRCHPSVGEVAHSSWFGLSRDVEDWSSQRRTDSGILPATHTTNIAL